MFDRIAETVLEEAEQLPEMRAAAIIEGQAWLGLHPDYLAPVMIGRIARAQGDPAGDGRAGVRPGHVTTPTRPGAAAVISGRAARAGRVAATAESNEYTSTQGAGHSGQP
jgi:hypothetical protein